MPARDPTLRTYRIALYALYGLFCAGLFFLLVRSVAPDLYGHVPPDMPQASATACLDREANAANGGFNRGDYYRPFSTLRDGTEAD